MSLPKDTYYDYIESFGLKETTGIDLPAETTGIFAGRESFRSNDVTLASYAFGQTFTVTPLELIRAQAGHHQRRVSGDPLSGGAGAGRRGQRGQPA